MRETYVESYATGARVVRTGDTMQVDMIYPNLAGHLNTVEVGLEDVRAADSILIRYDFDRDGYSILQASIFQWEVGDPICDSDWQEVAFIQAWAREVVLSPEAGR